MVFLAVILCPFSYTFNFLDSRCLVHHHTPENKSSMMRSLNFPSMGSISWSWMVLQGSMLYSAEELSQGSLELQLRLPSMDRFDEPGVDR